MKLFVCVLIVFLVGCQQSVKEPLEDFFLFDSKTLISRKALNGCLGGASIEGIRSSGLAPFAHYCMDIKEIDSLFVLYPDRVNKIEKSDTLIAVNVACHSIFKSSHTCSNTYGLNKDPILLDNTYIGIDSVVSDYQLKSWFRVLPNLTNDLTDSAIPETHDSHYTVYKFYYSRSMHADTILTDYFIPLRACEGC